MAWVKASIPLRQSALRHRVHQFQGQQWLQRECRWGPAYHFLFSFLINNCVVDGYLGSSSGGGRQNKSRNGFVFMSATPSSDFTSAKSGLFTAIPIPLAVSIEEPPPNAMMKSAPDAESSHTVFTLTMVDLVYIAVKFVGILASSKTLITSAATPNLIRSLSVTKGFLESATSCFRNNHRATACSKIRGFV